MILTLDTSDIDRLVQQGKDIVLEPKAENALLTLLAVKDYVDGALKKAEEAIEAKALQYNPDFSSVVGEKIKVGYRAFGERYKLDEAHLGDIPDGLYELKTIKRYTPNAKAIDTYIQKTGSIPLGIVTPERKKKITIKRKDDTTEE